MNPQMKNSSGFELMKQFKFGRRAPKRAAVLGFEQFWTGIIPDHPIVQDNLKSLAGWQMLGNDTYGDCVAVDAANYVRLVTATLATEYYPTLNEVYALYKTQNPGFPAQDNGMDMQTCWEYLLKNKWAGRGVTK